MSCVLARRAVLVCLLALLAALGAAAQAAADEGALESWRSSHEAEAAAVGLPAVDASAARVRQAEAAGKAARIAAAIKARPRLGTKRKRIRAAHDWLAKNVRYAVDLGRHTHEAYGALVAGRAQCAGYAQAFQLICEKLGYRCAYLVGTARGADGWGLHAWNKVRYRGAWKHVDVTFDDPGRLSHRYFLKTARAFKRDHRW